MTTMSVGSPPSSRAAPRPDARPLHVERVTDLAGLAALQQQWNALLSAGAAGTVFQTWEWSISWYEAFGRDSIDVLVVRTEGGQLVGLAPFGGGPIRAAGKRVRCLLGYRHVLTEYLDVLVHPDYAAEATAAILGAWSDDARAWDLIVLSSVRTDSSFLRQLAGQAARFGLRVERYWEGAGIRGPLATSWEAHLASLSRKARKTITNLANRLERERHRVRFVEVTDPADLSSSLDVFFELHERRARAELYPRHDSRYAKPVERRFLAAVATRLLARDGLFLTILEVNGQPAAAQIAFIHGGTLYLCDTGYDPEWAWYGVMTTLTARSIARAIERGCTELDLLLGSDQSKLRWGGSPSPVVSLVAGNGRLRSRAALSSHRLLRALPGLRIGGG